MTSPGRRWDYLGKSKTLEGGPKAVWRYQGKVYTANLDEGGEPLIGADGIPMGARIAPLGIARKFEGGQRDA